MQIYQAGYSGGMAMIESFGFDYPWTLLGLCVFVPVFIYDIAGRLSKRERSLPGKLKTKITISSLCFKIFIACIIIALASPHWGLPAAQPGNAGERRKGLDAVFAIDVSLSMDIRDMAGNRSRLESGLSAAFEIIHTAKNIRYAAAIGKGRGITAVPLTWDNEAIENFLESLNSSSITGSGTNLESLIMAACGTFQRSFQAKQVIILVSDGEALSGTLSAAIEKCNRDGVTIVSLGMGSNEGGQPPGNASVSRRDENALRAAAERTGGLYIDGNRSDAAKLAAMFLASLSSESGLWGPKEAPKDRRPLFIILAIVFFGLSKLAPLAPLTPYRSKTLRRTPVFIAAFLTFFILNSCSKNRLLIMEANYYISHGRHEDAITAFFEALDYQDAAPYAEYGLGSVFYLLGEGKAALDHYNAGKSLLENFPPGENRELQYRINYNSGIVHFSEGDFGAAEAAFIDALRIGPDKIDAKRNLELSQMSLSRNNAGEGDSAEEGKAIRDVLFEYVRQQEQNQWKSREWDTGEDDTGPDY
jgi:Ca-activated chloride channel family protein